MSGKNWNLYYDTGIKIRKKEHILDMISLWISIGLLWYSFCNILTEVFPRLLKPYEVSGGNVSGLRLEVILPWMVALWLATGGVYIKHLLVRIALLLVTIAIPIVYFVRNFNKIIQGAIHIGYQYMALFNPYHGTDVSLPTGRMDYTPIALTCLLMLLWFLIWMLAKSLKKRVLLIIFPVLAVVAEMVVGYSPKGIEVFLVFLAAMLLLRPKGAGLSSRIIVVVASIIIMLLTSTFWKKDIQELIGKKEEILSLQQEIDLSKIKLDDFIMDLLLENEQVGNYSPNFTGKEVLRVETYTTPESSLYLRGFYGTSYENGMWTCDTKTFEAACKEAGFSREYAAQQVANMPRAFMNFLYKAVSSYTESEYKIEYYDGISNTLYTPYVFDYTSFDEKYTYKGDFLLKKNLWDKEVIVKGSKMGDMLMEQMQEDELFTAADAFAFHSALGAVSGINEWYNTFCKHYGQPSQEIPHIVDVAERLGGNYRASYVYDNYQRYAMVEDVKDYLHMQLSYSLELDELPKGADPIGYALMTSHEGYCMHYASAGTLLLQQMGVPARYASGYVVRSSDFEWDADLKKSVADITDYSAHAWVEVYFDNIGWIPIEMTEGYEADAEQLPTVDGTAEEETQSQGTSESESVSEMESGSVSESQSEAESESVLPSESESESESENQPILPPNQDASEGVGGAGEPEEKDSPMGYIIMLVIISGLCVGTVFLGKRMHRAYIMRLEREVSKKLTRRVIKRINKRIYNTLKRRSLDNAVRLMKKKNMSDVVYEELLKKTFAQVSIDDWSKYMEIVKKAHYSKEPISVEEMQHCYSCYIYLKT